METLEKNVCCGETCCITDDTVILHFLTVDLSVCIASYNLICHKPKVDWSGLKWLCSTQRECNHWFKLLPSCGSPFTAEADTACMRSCIGRGSVPCGNANLETQGLKPARSFHRYLAPPRVARRSTWLGLAENNSSHFCHAPDIPAGRPQSGFGGGGDAASRRAPRRIPDPPSAPRPTGVLMAGARPLRWHAYRLYVHVVEVSIHSWSICPMPILIHL